MKQEMISKMKRENKKCSKVNKMSILEPVPNGHRGITLIALVITIIVLLILAAVSIATLTGENGILAQAENAKKKTEEAAKKEKELLQSYEDTIGDITEGEIWRASLNTTEYSTNVNINVASKYYEQEKLPDTLKGYKELYILRVLGIKEYNSMDEYIIGTMGVSSIEEALDLYKEETGEEVTRDQLVYEVIVGGVTNEDEALEKFGFSKENIEQIELEYEEKKSQETEVEVPERYKNRTYTITYPDGSTQTVNGEELATFEGAFKVTENNNQYTIKIKDSENHEENLSITVNNFVKYATYEEGDYTYNFYNGDEGYSVEAKDKTLTEYGEILSEIEGIPVVYMNSTFEDCINMTKSPKIPDGITDVIQTYWNCTNLMEAPEIPTGVTSMKYTFYKCSNLTTAPKIPATVTNMDYTFAYCEKLVGAPEIPRGVTSMNNTFAKCTSLIKVPVIPNTVINMNATFDRCTNLEEAPEIPESVERMWDTFYGCTKLKEAPDIPSKVSMMQSVFEECTGLSGKVVINSVELIGNELGKEALKNTGTQGTGLIVIVPNDEVRELLIQNSGYNPDKVKIVKSEDEI